VKARVISSSLRFEPNPWVEGMKEDTLQAGSDTNVVGPADDGSMLRYTSGEVVKVDDDTKSGAAERGKSEISRKRGWGGPNDDVGME